MMIKRNCEACRAATVALPAFGAGIITALFLPPLALACVCAGASVAFGAVCLMSI